MKKILKRFIFIIAPVFMAVACSGMVSQSEVEALNDAEAIGSPFTQKLSAEYRAMANYEQNDMYDYPDALHFARKGLLAAQGENVLPEPIDNWNIDESLAGVFIEERARLLYALENGARDMAPIESAIAQTRYDCWIEQQEELWQDSEINICRDEYYSAIERLEDVLDLTASPEPQQGQIEQIPSVEPQEDLEPIISPDTLMEEDLTSLPELDQQGDIALEDAMFLVFFDFDSSKIEAGAEDVVAAVAEQILGRDDILSVVIKGHADTSGPAKYNEKLSLRRANAVKNALVAAGIPADMIETRAFGESDLLVETPNGTREPANRRSEITFE